MLIDYSDNDVVVGGRAGASQGLARYNVTDGALDTGFGSSGKATTDFNGSATAEFVLGLAIDTNDNNKIVAVGEVSDFAVATAARYHSNGTLDTNGDADSGVHFDADGKATFAGMDVAWAVAIHDGKIVMGGVNSSNVAVARMLNNGQKGPKGPGGYSARPPIAAPKLPYTGPNPIGKIAPPSLPKSGPVSLGKAVGCTVGIGVLLDLLFNVDKLNKDEDEELRRARFMEDFNNRQFMMVPGSQMGSSIYDQRGQGSTDKSVNGR